MAKLSAKERAELPDSAFAYIDAKGKRRLPLNDESHVRNALSRFGQVRFETQVARDEARRRVLNAAKRHGIVPVGFIQSEFRVAHERAIAGRLIIELGRVETSADLQAELRRTLDDDGLEVVRWSKSEGTYVGCDDTPVRLPSPSARRKATFLQGRGRPLMAILHARSVLRSPEITEAVMAAVHLVAGRELLDEIDEIGVATEGLPDGEVTFLLTDIEGSTPLLHELGDRYAEVLADVRTLIREAVLQAGGRQVEARADEFVAVFDEAGAALDAAVAMQRAIGAHEWPGDRAVRVRAGVHAGEILLTEAGYVGITVHTAARVMSAAHGGQILVTGETLDRLDVDATPQTTSRGVHRLKGLADDHELHQVVAEGLLTDFAPPAI